MIHEKIASQEVGRHDQTVFMNSESGLEVSKFLGILWPPAIFKDHVGRDPVKDEISAFVGISEAWCVCYTLSLTLQRS